MDATAVAAITGAVDFATIVAGIGTVAAAVAVVMVAGRGARMLISIIRG